MCLVEHSRADTGGKPGSGNEVIRRDGERASRVRVCNHRRAAPKEVASVRLPINDKDVVPVDNCGRDAAVVVAGELGRKLIDENLNVGGRPVVKRGALRRAFDADEGDTRRLLSRTPLHLTIGLRKRRSSGAGR